MTGNDHCSSSRGPPSPSASAGPAVEHPNDAPWLDAPGAVFVTLTLDGDSAAAWEAPTARRPLFDDVMDNAKAAAFEDPRFLADERRTSSTRRASRCRCSPLEKLEVQNEAELLEQLRPGVDGLQIAWGPTGRCSFPRCGTSSPTTARSSLPEAQGRPAARIWPTGTHVHRFTAEAFARAQA